VCGISGVVYAESRPAPPALVQAMGDILSHRGPDGAGVHVAGPVGLAHRRLAIIDIATGDQPMASDDGAIVIVFNGEIYNFRELRRELEDRGHRFRTTSDTEVLLRCYEAHGVDCLRRLRGMFAFALWDGRRRELLLARDRLGIKPLVYAWDGQRLAFASEIKALLQDPALSRELDWAAVHEYLVHHYIPEPRTIFRDVRKLPAGSYLLLRLDRGAPELRRYWDLHFSVEARKDDEWIEGLRWHLQDAVQSHMVADVPIGAFLSGGLDSSSVVALMAQAAGRIRTFSIGFSEADFDELEHARAVAKRWDTEHYEFIVKPDALEVMPRLSWQFDEPFADASALPTYHVARMTREHVTVALSGDGGDEGFAGYRRYADASALHASLDRFPGTCVRALWRTAGRALPPWARGQAYCELRGADPLDRYFQMMTYQRSATLATLLTPDAASRIGTEVSPTAFRQLVARGNTPDYLSTLQYIDVHTYLPGDILTKVDRMSMLVSLEARVPLLDHRLLEYAATMPAGLKLEGRSGKAILRRAMAADLPPAILARRKMGFGVPLGAWFRGDLASYAQDVLIGREASARGIFAPHAVSALLDEHMSGRRDRSAHIWALICFEEWARQWHR
jgi:asparagine synthase (glutamine-hydrolysing)